MTNPQQIYLGLQEAYTRSLADPQTAFAIDLHQGKYIIFSDQHKGNRDGADDFLLAERAYNAALAYYYRLGHTLVVLGDVEELWEERIPTVLKAYAHTFHLESRFHAAGRYIRIWGNHDDDWQYPEEVKKHLDPLYTKQGGEPLRVPEGVRLLVTDGDEPLGTIFMVHGHQGTLESDRFAALSKFFVRYFWRPFQRLTNFRSTTPADSWQLRETHNVAMYQWAASQEKLVLITGHTHRPVFASKTHADDVYQALTAVLAQLATDPDNRELQAEAATLEAELEWIRAQGRQNPGHEGEIKHYQPAYFNTGCCCYSDGDITGLEIDEGQIRLVRFPNNDKKPRPHILEEADLRLTLLACSQPVRPHLDERNAV